MRIGIVLSVILLVVLCVDSISVGQWQLYVTSSIFDKTNDVQVVNVSSSGSNFNLEYKVDTFESVKLTISMFSQETGELSINSLVEEEEDFESEENLQKLASFELIKEKTFVTSHGAFQDSKGQKGKYQIFFNDPTHIFVNAFYDHSDDYITIAAVKIQNEQEELPWWQRFNLPLIMIVVYSVMNLFNKNKQAQAEQEPADEPLPPSGIEEVSDSE
eukprot:TRINITY_DN4234_c0_g1_i1.p1 TRINITY_DN4234_c0_g1~~TRINITY_DN4234_c0_g1_i1.p1  ORF type:complete len:216 (-),score=38.86 TRINITY_DN4234_c0_g1_i1:212-859(-)